MTNLKITGRLFALVMVAVLAFTSLTASAAATRGFVTDDGRVVLSDVRVETWSDGYGDYTAKITLNPTYEELQALLNAGSHVDLEVTFAGLSRSGEGRVDFSKSASYYVRDIGSGELISEHVDPTVRVLGFNLARWNPGDEVNITVTVYGYVPSGGVLPSVSVDMVSSTWWFADGSCTVAHTYNIAGRDDQYCATWNQRSHLTGDRGNVRFAM